jgi:hypothetical protein
MKKLLFLSTLLLCSLLQFSCNPDDVTNNPTTTNPVDVYVAGSKDGKACYWKNGQIVMLDSVGFENISVKKIIVSNGDVYVLGTGNANSFGGTLLWKNGVLTNLTSTLGTSEDYLLTGNLIDFDVVGNDVYFVSYVSTYTQQVKYCYWKNNLRTTLSENILGFTNKIEIKVIGNDVYITGTKDGKIGHFINNTFYDQNYLLNDPILNGIAINNNENQAYTYGYSYITQLLKFKNTSNNSETTIPSNIPINYMLFDNNNLYYSDSEKIFKNGNLIYQIPIASNNIFDIKIIDNIIYKIAGSQINNSNPILQINDTTIMTGSIDEIFNSLFIVQN